MLTHSRQHRAVGQTADSFMPCLCRRNIFYSTFSSDSPRADGTSAPATPESYRGRSVSPQGRRRGDGDRRHGSRYDPETPQKNTATEEEYTRPVKDRRCASQASALRGSPDQCCWDELWVRLLVAASAEVGAVMFAVQRSVPTAPQPILGIPAFQLHHDREGPVAR